MVKLLYFASVREMVGRSEETVEIPGDVTAISELILWLRKRGPEYEAAFSTSRQIRTAVDQEYANADTSIDGANEIAFFPPVTGG